MSPEHIDVLAPSLKTCCIAFDSDLLYRGLRSGESMLPGEDERLTRTFQIAMASRVKTAKKLARRLLRSAIRGPTRGGPVRSPFGPVVGQYIQSKSPSFRQSGARLLSRMTGRARAQWAWLSGREMGPAIGSDVFSHGVRGITALHEWLSCHAAMFLGCHHVLEDTAQGLIAFLLEFTIINHSDAITSLGQSLTA